jgi:CheY-like chemotaxis protein
VADLISAIAALLWPLLVIVVLLVFGRQLLSKLRSSDDVTLEIGGQRINFRQATDQQSDMITDLQHEVASLKRRLDEAEGAAWGGAEARPTRPGDRGPASQGGVSPESEVAAEEELEHELDTGWTPERRQVPEPTGPASRSILWVDDHPENNAVLADSWRRDGTHVAIARSTSEALDLLEGQQYGLVISDMGRRESGLDVPDAGLRLLARIRATDPVTPFVLYASFDQESQGARIQEAKLAGATLVTDSTFELVDFASRWGVLTRG